MENNLPSNVQPTTKTTPKVDLFDTTFGGILELINQRVEDVQSRAELQSLMVLSVMRLAPSGMSTEEREDFINKCATTCHPLMVPNLFIKVSKMV